MYTMLNHIPLSFLRVFEAAARTGSFRAAAEDLHLTPSAVSHAVRKLEQTLGATLFMREGRGMRLTRDGEVLIYHLGQAFELIRRGMEEVSRQGPALLRLHSAPSFAAQWLTPRLSRFLAQCPGVEVRLAAGTDYARFVTGDFDADIMYGLPRREGLVVLPLGEETVQPLCSPKMAESIHEAADLYHQMLIESDNKQVRWSMWFAANGLMAPPPNGTRFDRSFLAIAAATDGLGIALESSRLAEREIRRGDLVAPLAGRAQDIHYVGHHLVFPETSKQRRPVRQFVEWLATELSLDLGADWDTAADSLRPDEKPPYSIQRIRY